jgi:bifunctional N-acetylglucosamine-1-phosphate-uridyltransferase/glucosamine-1-phosphate-acetyltransferase GlmU-like protein
VAAEAKMSADLHPDQRVELFKRFLSGETEARSFRHPTCHPSRPTGFCPCDGALPAKMWFYLKATLLLTTLKLPFNKPKVALLRRLGARVGRHVYLSADVWIDPTFPQLLTIEDDVMVGVGVKIALHEFGPDYFSAGRVTLRQGAVIGGFALIRHGVEIGAGAVVAGGAAVGRDVPSGKLAIGNPARVMPLTNPQSPSTKSQ